jgi:hypothetical protein
MRGPSMFSAAATRAAVLAGDRSLSAQGLLGRDY